MKLRHSVIFFFSVILILAVLSITFPQPALNIGKISLRFPSADKMLEQMATDTLRTAEQMLMEAEQTLKMSASDSVAQAQADSLSFYKNFFANSPMRIACPNNDPSYLFPLFDALRNATNKGLHVMHYGDSQIEGDRISGYLRTKLQKQFGGSGPGFIPMQQPIAAMNVKQTLSDSISMYYAGGMIGNKAPHNRYGAMAQMAQINTTDTIQLDIKSYHGRNISQLTIFAGAIDSAFTFIAGGKLLHFAPSKQMIKQKISFNRAVANIEAHFSGKAEVYGLYLSGSNGVNVSNIPLRGSDGTFFSRIDKEEFRAMHKAVNTQLIIMEFGGNALPMITDTTSVDHWCKNFRRQVELMTQLVPQAKVLVIGPADMSVKIEGELQTHPMLPYLTQKMEQEVTASGAAFWNMYAVMGGRQSMLSWVSHSPAWAAPDYVHFTQKGANRISEVLCEALNIYYNYQNYLKQIHQ